MLALIGDQFMPERGERVPEDWWSPDEICGCTISVRGNEDILAVWHKTGSDDAIKARIRYASVIFFYGLTERYCCRDVIRKVLQLGPATILEYKSNNGKCPLNYTAF